MKISSPVFEHNGTIPQKYTCQGKNVNPPLTFSDIPAEAKSLALIMDDPDVPNCVRPDCMYDHWILYNVSPSIRSIAEHAAAPPGVQGKNTSGQNRYTGPCPPDREHRYFFKLYALDKMLSLPEGSSKRDLEKAMKGHILAEAELIGRYEKS